MSAESTARELIDAFNAGEDEAVHLPTDWTVLIVHDALDDLVSAGLRSDVARRVIVGDGHPLEKGCWSRTTWTGRERPGTCGPLT